MKIQPKPPEVIEAQMAAFASERVDHWQDKGHLLQSAGALAAGGVTDVVRVTEGAEWHHDAEGNNVRIPGETEVVAGRADDYVKFLREKGGSRHEDIDGRAQILAAFDEFAPEIEKLQAENAELNRDTAQRHPDFLESGSNSRVYKLEHNGKNYAVRLTNGNSAGQIDINVSGVVRGRGVPHLEQMVALSYEKGITISEIIPGVEIGKMTAEKISSISDEQLSTLVDTLIATNERGINIDPKPSNFLYDEKEGFGIVDYSSNTSKSSETQALSDTVGYAVVALAQAGIYGNNKKSGANRTVEDYVAYAEIMRANLGVMERYRDIVAAKLRGEERKKTLAVIDERIETHKSSVETQSDPKWINGQIEQEKRWQKQRQEKVNKKAGAPAEDDWLELDVV